jgi:hypothetical protein
MWPLKVSVLEPISGQGSVLEECKEYFMVKHPVSVKEAVWRMDGETDLCQGQGKSRVI